MIGDCNGSLLQQSVLSMADSVESALMENAAVASEMFLGEPERRIVSIYSETTRRNYEWN